MYLIVDVCDVMGVNIVNIMVEVVVGYIEEIIGGKVWLCIFFNLVDLWLVWVRVKVFVKVLVISVYCGEEVIDGIVDVYEFVVVDFYCVVIYNKGIMNGIDLVIVVIGNDWCVVEVGVYVYVCCYGCYMLLMYWEIVVDGDLVGILEIFMLVGLVGGVIKMYFVVCVVLKILGV